MFKFQREHVNKASSKENSFFRATFDGNFSRQKYFTSSQQAALSAVIAKAKTTTQN